MGLLHVHVYPNMTSTISIWIGCLGHFGHRLLDVVPSSVNRAYDSTYHEQDYVLQRRSYSVSDILLVKKRKIRRLSELKLEIFLLIVTWIGVR